MRGPRISPSRRPYTNTRIARSKAPEDTLTDEISIPPVDVLDPEPGALLARAPGGILRKETLPFSESERPALDNAGRSQEGNGCGGGDGAGRQKLPKKQVSWHDGFVRKFSSEEEVAARERDYAVKRAKAGGAPVARAAVRASR